MFSILFIMLTLVSAHVSMDGGTGIVYDVNTCLICFMSALTVALGSFIMLTFFYHVDTCFICLISTLTLTLWFFYHFDICLIRFMSALTLTLGLFIILTSVWSASCQYWPWHLDCLSCWHLLDHKVKVTVDGCSLCIFLIYNLLDVRWLDYILRKEFELSWLKWWP